MRAVVWKAAFPALLLAISSLAAQSAPEPPPATTSAESASSSSTEDTAVRFRSFSRMVLVDVVVKDRKGLPLHGLKAADFELTEDGAPQRIASFSESTERMPKRLDRLAEQYVDVFTNAQLKNAEDIRPSIILLDLLNTSMRDRPVARKAMIKFVKERMRKDEPIAIFVLWNQLEMIQDFTGEKALLHAAIERDQRTMADTRRDNLNTDMITLIADLLAADESAGAIYEEMAKNTERIEKQYEQERIISRVEKTLGALRAIARFSEKYRGRKTLVWLSAAFPFMMQTDFGLIDFDLQLRQTSNQLTSAQVAVYPVDVRGLGPIEAKPFEEDLSRKWLHSPQDIFPQRVDAAYRELFDSQDTMKDIADLTGGIAYINRNDLDVAIAAALEDNRDTYTIGYYPTKTEFNSRFRRIKVRLRGKEATLRHRRGYYATGFSVENRTSSDLLAALERDPTVSAQIPLYSRISAQPPAAGVSFNIELFVKGGNIHYTDVADRSAAFLDFAAVALGPNGRTVARTWHRGELKLDREKAEKSEQAGLLYTLPINLPAGQYRIRAGVRDSFTGRIGTVEIPVVVK